MDCCASCCPRGLRKRWDKVPANPNGASIRSKLILLLPRLRRFAAVLAGEAAKRDELLRVGCKAMLERHSHYQQGTPFDRWAFSQIYGTWLKRLREHSEPLTESQADGALFVPQTPGLRRDSDFASFFAGLPPQQRSVMLLVYGERFSYVDAAMVVDAPSETIARRAGRALANYAEHLNVLTSAAGPDASVEMLRPSSEPSDD